MSDYCESEGHMKFRKSVLIMLTMLMLIKSFFFMRLFRSMAHLVSMMRRVFLDLQAFMLFFFVLLWIMSLILNVLEMGNIETGKSVERKKLLQTLEYPGVEYKHIPLFLRQLFSTTRIALGDFDFGESTFLEPFENRIFWAYWLVLVTVTCIVFLNFIVAEVGSSYNSVNESVIELIEQDRC